MLINHPRNRILTYVLFIVCVATGVAIMFDSTPTEPVRFFRGFMVIGLTILLLAVTIERDKLKEHARARTDVDAREG